MIFLIGMKSFIALLPEEGNFGFIGVQSGAVLLGCNEGFVAYSFDKIVVGNERRVSSLFPLVSLHLNY